ncbi:MAG TPA: hypothetical protein VJ890_20445, partial [Vineibacter sp.]|nr:hypothetical protein [Vineibacter sp.]
MRTTTEHAPQGVIAPAATARLGKLIPMLGSTHDGEIVAAACAIGRTLAAAGLDWHALAERITAPPTTADDHDADADDWRAMAADCLGWEPLLSRRERTFVKQMAVAYYQPTVKQLAWLQ